MNIKNKHIIYFDNAASSFPKPNEVIKTVSRSLRNNTANAGRSGHFLSIQAASAIYQCREKIKEFVNSESSERICFTKNATEAINTALFGTLNDGDHVLCSDREHNSVARVLCQLESRNVKYDTFTVYPNDDEKTIDDIKNKLKENTKMICAMSASNLTGVILPIKKIGDLCYKNKLIFMVDASQSIGYQPLDMQAMHIDLLAASAHKGLLGIQGLGFLAISDNVNVKPFMYGGTGANSMELTQPAIYPERLESGTLNLVAIEALNTSLDYINKNGQNKLYQREMSLRKNMIEKLRNMKDIILYEDYENTLPILLFNIRDVSSNEVENYLSDNGICVRSGLHCSPLAHKAIGTIETGGVRISFGCFNKIKQVEKFCDVLNKITK